MFEELDDSVEQEEVYERLSAENVDKEIRALLGSPADGDGTSACRR